MTPITAPGVYVIPADDYHADPVPGGSISASGARRILPRPILGANGIGATVELMQVPTIRRMASRV